MSEPCCQGECPVCLEADREDGHDDADAEVAREQTRRDRERARELFVQAGRPVPAWLRGGP